MNRFYTYITLGFVLFTLNLKAQIYDTTSYYIATNYSFKKILTDFIEDEKTYIHYDSSCIFTIHIQDYKNSVLIILISNGCTQERDNVVNTLEFRKEINKTLFFLKHENHIFFLTNQSGIDKIDSILIEKSNDYYTFELKDEIEKGQNSKLNEKNVFYNKISEYNLFEDDSRPEKIWICLFDNDLEVLSKVKNNYK